MGRFNFILEDVRVVLSQVIFVFAFILVFFCSASLAKENQIINGSFEQDIGGTQSSWTITGTAQVNSNWASDGEKSLTIGRGDSSADAIISQDFATIPGVSYRLAFELSANGDPVNTFTTIVEVIGSQKLLNKRLISNPNPPSNPFTSYNFIFIADSVSTILRFSDVSSSPFQLDGILDNISVSVSDGETTKPKDCIATYNADGTLNIPYVSVPNGFGGVTIYEADMAIIPLSSPLSFELIDARIK